MKRLALIGIGSGNPEQVTVEAINALNRTDVFFVLDKGREKRELTALRVVICERYIERPGYRIIYVEDPPRDSHADDYPGSVQAWHEQRAQLLARLVDRDLEDGQSGAFMVWGDPSLYDATLRVVERMRAMGLAFEYQVIPGISSVQALAARHRIGLNRIGEPVHITTGRRLATTPVQGIDNLVVMLDGHCAFAALEDAGLEIFWGAYLGTPDELLIAGPLLQVRERILAARAEARQRKGWIMDTYLLRRPMEHQ
jgi:precorrin-6A synthase